MPFGSPTTPDLPQFAGAGMKTPFGIALLPPGSRIAAYVRSTGLQSGDDQYIAAQLVPTLSAGLARARSGLGDTVVVLPGHSESVTDATMLTNLVAGTRIVGFGRGSNMPVFRWTATAAQWPIAVADVIVSGLRLRLEGANGIVKAILVTAADVGFYGNDIEVASGAALKATIALEVGAGASRFELIGNVVRGTATHNVTNGINIVAAVDRVRIEDNEFQFAATALNGQINVAAAATNLCIARNIAQNTVTQAALVYFVTLGNVVSTGIISDNRVAVDSTGAVASQGFALGASSLVRFSENYVSDEALKTGTLVPGAGT